MNRSCPICGDHFEPEPNHKGSDDCLECWLWSTPGMVRWPLRRDLWQQAKRFGAGSLSKRLALREPAFGLRVPDPSATQRVPVFVARETVAVRPIGGAA